MMQLSQMNDINDMKMWHHIGGKAGVLQQHNANNQGPYHQQQMKPGTPFSISSQQVLQASSPQIGHHPSPQIDQQNLLSSRTKAGTPLQPADSPFVVQFPSTSMAPSPMPGESEKIASGVSSLSNPGSVHQPTTAASMLTQSLATGTPGISASPLLVEFSSPDGSHGVASTIAAGNSNVVEQPLERLLKQASEASFVSAARINVLVFVLSFYTRVSVGPDI
ncbi:hypothetical protein CDL12_00639 [Handroanthus impetiginosus]|uniref:Uncharacterized protein n=1 Tax=Handroanthus impetiginosus TaxID=429701 RepID=A0A2G9IA38_9LAMI|nr:hypothetical protein CDL12_00639 [Handroanthus impetiginosus]